jgi:hypothetical protein
MLKNLLDLTMLMRAEARHREDSAQSARTSKPVLSLGWSDMAGPESKGPLATPSVRFPDPVPCASGRTNERNVVRDTGSSIEPNATRSGTMATLRCRERRGAVTAWTIPRDFQAGNAVA